MNTSSGASISCRSKSIGFGIPSGGFGIAYSGFVDLLFLTLLFPIIVFEFLRKNALSLPLILKSLEILLIDYAIGFMFLKPPTQTLNPMVY